MGNVDTEKLNEARKDALLGLLDDLTPPVRKALLAHFVDLGQPAVQFLQEVARGSNRILSRHAAWFLEEIKFSDPVDMNVFPIEATGILQLGMIYGGIGAGYYIFDADNIEVPSRSADLKNAFGWYLVGGIELSLSSFGVFGELKWTMLSPDIDGVDPSIDDVPTSLDADGLGLNVGVMFGIPGK